MRVQVVEAIDLALPFWRCFEACAREPYAFLLDSARASPHLGRYSFIGARAEEVLTARHGGAGDCADPFSRLRELLATLAPDVRLGARAPVPFTAGAAGYLGYEAWRFIEPCDETRRRPRAVELPDVCFVFPRVVLAHEHETGRTWLAAMGTGAGEADAAAAARAEAGAFRDALERIEVEAPRARYLARGAPEASLDEAAHLRAVAAAREHIVAGEAFEVCVTRTQVLPYDGDPWPLYAELRRINPAPFAAYLKLPGAAVVSSSPERFLRLGADRVAETRPIKGTRPRGPTPEEDARLRDELADSEKDRAENMMIVDLARNDLGRVCRLGSVEVSELMAIESYATVHQMVSTVRGVLDDGLDAVDLVRACFPGGSMTGAPKIEAMKIIDRLEPWERGVYSGAIGYFDASGAADLSIVIRTIVAGGGRASLGTGGAVVADSDPEEEYRESEDKARALIRALRGPGG